MRIDDGDDDADEDESGDEVVSEKRATPKRRLRKTTKVIKAHPVPLII